MKEPWEQLIERYANGRQICNCGQAYYTNCGTAWVNGKKLENQPACEHGCDANQYSVKDYIAERVLAELVGGNDSHA